MVNMVNTAVNNNIYAGRKSGSKYNQSKAFQQKEVLETPDVAAVNKYANVQEIYEALKCNVSCRGYEQGQDEIAEKEIQNDEPEISNDSTKRRLGQPKHLSFTIFIICLYHNAGTAPFGNGSSILLVPRKIGRFAIFPAALIWIFSKRS